METSGFIAGATVVNIGGGTYGRRVGTKYQIAKVYKNGNFVLEGRKGQQYSTNGMGTCAFKTGNSFSRDHLEVWNEASHGAEIAACAKKHADSRTVQEFTRWLDGRRSGDGRYHLTDEQIAAMKSIVEEAK